MRKSTILSALVFVLTGAIVTAILWDTRQDQINGSTPSSTAKPSTTPTKTPLPDYTEPEMKAFFNDKLMPALYNASRDYPIASIREKMHRLMERIRRKDILMGVQPFRYGGGMARSGERDNKPTLEILIPAVMDFYHQLDGDKASFQDEMIATVLHEQYHIDHHHPQTPRPGPIEAESEAWVWTIEKVYLPMSRNGRVKEVDETVNNAIEAYHASNGNPDHSQWKSFVRTVATPL